MGCDETFPLFFSDAGPSSTPDEVKSELDSLPLFPGLHLGRVKSFNSTQGYGFIECAVTKALFGQDVFLHKRQMVEGLDVGSKVHFRCASASSVSHRRTASSCLRTR